MPTHEQMSIAILGLIAIIGLSIVFSVCYMIWQQQQSQSKPAKPNPKQGSSEK